MIPARTCITLGLRVIPPSAGLSRDAEVKVTSLAHHIPKQTSAYLFRIVRDLDLEKEIARERKGARYG